MHEQIQDRTGRRLRICTREPGHEGSVTKRTVHRKNETEEMGCGGREQKGKGRKIKDSKD
jgi:hypothetical protein